MTSAENYGSAAFRHFRDAQHLLIMGRIDNSAYLAGYVVECSLKLLIQCTDTISPKPLGHDLVNLAGRALVLAAILAPGSESYRADHPDVAYLLVRWTPELRYAISGTLTVGEAERFARGAQVCLETIVGALILDGIAELPG